MSIISGILKFKILNIRLVGEILDFPESFHFLSCSQVNFSIILQPKSIVAQRQFDFSFEVNSSTAQVNALDDTRARFSIPILENAVLKIEG